MKRKTLLSSQDLQSKTKRKGKKGKEMNCWVGSRYLGD
jgi:hypothetical protein